MKTMIHLTAAKRWFFPILFLFPVLSCTTVKEVIWPATATPTPTVTPTPTPTCTPTPTRIPLAQRDLRDIALRKSDLADSKGFMEIDVPDIKQMVEELAATGGAEITPMLENVEKGYMTYLINNGDQSIYLNLILVYGDEGYAATAYESTADTSSGSAEVDIPRIGDDSLGTSMFSSGTIGYEIAWRWKEAMVMLLYLGKDDIGMDELVRIAQNIQERMESA
jgi:hypothetical protein